MSRISVGLAWDETKAFLDRERRLIVPVVLALVTLPLAALRIAIPELADLKAVMVGAVSLSGIVLLYLVLFIELVAWLALIRLALGRAEAVGATILAAIPRTLVLLVSLALLGLAFAILVTIAMISLAIGQGAVDRGTLPPGMAVMFTIAAVAMFLLFFRMILLVPAAAAEKTGSLALIKRGWQLGKGNGARLIAIMMLVFLSSVILNAAVVTVVGLFAKLVLGSNSGATVGGLLAALAAGLLSALIVSVQAGLLASLYRQATAQRS